VLFAAIESFLLVFKNNILLKQVFLWDQNHGSCLAAPPFQDLILSGFHVPKTMKNRNVYDENPPQGLSEALRVGFFLNCLLLIHREGDPSGAAAIIVNGGVFKKISYPS
jgi:hypothetical protein